jgi:8-oxo-dGTP pyrophosphatase MutT (NUDIX family)
MAADELVAVYSPDGAEVGSATRARMRAEGLWHAATAILVRSGDGRRVYVHRRSPDKDVYPGLRDCGVGGVVDAGESPDDGARRELAEELGITGVPLRPTAGPSPWSGCAATTTDPASAACGRPAGSDAACAPARRWRIPSPPRSFSIRSSPTSTVYGPMISRSPTVRSLVTNSRRRSAGTYSRPVRT